MPAIVSGRRSWLTRERLLVAGLLLLTAVVRGGVLWAMRGNLEQDPDAYREIAENVLQHGVYGLGKDGDPDADPFSSTPLTPTAYRPPLYPIVLSNLPAADGKYVSLAKVAVLHVLLGMATVWLTYLTARKLGPSGKVSPSGPEGPEAAPTSTRAQVGQGLPDVRSVMAALLVACDPILLNQQTLVMTETLATFLAILSLWCLVRFSTQVAGTLRVPPAANGTRSVPTTSWWNAALAGGAIGLAALCRPTFLPWLGLVGLVMISDFRFQISDLGRWARRALPNFAALAVVAAAVMSPWVIRNQQVFGKPILTTTHGGYTLWLGNNEAFFAWLRKKDPGLPWDVKRGREREHIVNETMMRLDLLLRIRDNPDEFSDVPMEVVEDRFHRHVAIKSIENDPRGFAVACIYRVRQLWSPLPHKLSAEESTGRRLLRYATAAWYGGVYLLAAVGVWRLKWRLVRQPWVWGVLLCLAFTSVHTLYWCNLRMRAPLMPFIALVAAAAIQPGKWNADRTDDAD